MQITSGASAQQRMQEAYQQMVASQKVWKQLEAASVRIEEIHKTLQPGIRRRMESDGTFNFSVFV